MAGSRLVRRRLAVGTNPFDRKNSNLNGRIGAKDRVVKVPTVVDRMIIDREPDGFRHQFATHLKNLQNRVRTLSYAQRNERTISNPAVVEGFGYWSGRDVRVEFRPAPPGTGLVFVRSDLSADARIPANVEHRVEVPRRTVLRRGAASVEMIEHVLAALSGLQIDNCEIWVDQPEMPGLDGSSLKFVESSMRRESS